jgi:hypothetical protein
MDNLEKTGIKKVLPQGKTGLYPRFTELVGQDDD